MRTAVLLGGAREVGAAGQLRASRPDYLSAALHLGREELVLQVSGQHACPFGERHYPLGLRHVAREWLLAGDADERATPGVDRLDDLLHVLDTLVVGTTDPDRVDGGIGHHVADGLVRLRLAHAELPRECRGRGGVPRVGAPHAEYVGITHADESLQVEFRVEAAPDDPYAESLRSG
jgi:hypothetical protein